MSLKRPYRKVVYRQKVKILLVRIVNRNLGDAVIADNAAFLIRQILARLPGEHYVLQPYNISSEDFELVKTADLIIFAGGGLIKFRQEHFYKYVPDLLECAREWDIPVFFNSVGVEGCDAEDERCQRLMRTLKFPCVKGITVRDDLDTLRQGYLDGVDINASAAIDTAVFTPQVYGIRKDPDASCIGLGIVRWRIFEDYGLAEVTKQFQLSMWKGIIRQLEEKGCQWKLFVNGLKSDYDFALEVLDYAGRTAQAKQLLVRRPAHGRELVETIASFAGVIACRMHAGIIAYALEIPAVGLVWNDKMTFWGERIGCPERFLHSGQFEPEQIVRCLMDSMSAGVRPCGSVWKKSIRAPLKKFIRRYVTQAWKQKRRVYLPAPERMGAELVAVASGGMGQLYTGMNAPEGLEASLRNGFRNLEADLRLTTDGRLVCVNGWSRGSYIRLGLDPDAFDRRGVDYETFMNCRQYDGHFGVMDAQQLFSRMRQVSGAWRLMLDIGRPDKTVLSGMLGRLKELCAGDRYWQKHLFVRLQGKYDVEEVQKAGLPVQLMYYVPVKEKREEKNLTAKAIARYCKKQNIQWVSMPKEALEESVMACLKQEGMRVCVFSYDTYTEALMASGLGADWIGTSCLSPACYEQWYEKSRILVFGRS